MLNIITYETIEFDLSKAKDITLKDGRVTVYFEDGTEQCINDLTYSLDINFMYKDLMYMWKKVKD